MVKRDVETAKPISQALSLLLASQGGAWARFSRQLRFRPFGSIPSIDGFVIPPDALARFLAAAGGAPLASPIPLPASDSVVAFAAFEFFADFYGEIDDGQESNEDTH